MNAPADESGPLLDESHLAQLREVLEDEFHNILSAYLIDAQSRRMAIVLAAAAQDGARLREAAHNMKGSARNMGAHALAERARSLELLADRADWPGITAALANLDDCLQRTRAAFESL